MNWDSRQGSSEYLKLLGYKRYHFRRWPHSSGRRFVLLHGRGESADIWTPFACRLAEEADVVAVDLRGHGGTPWDPDQRYEFAEFIDDLRLQILHWAARCVLVGHGLGGRIALAAASEFPALLDGLVLAEVDPKQEPPTTLIERLSEALQADTYRVARSERFDGPVWRAIHNDLTWAQPGGGRRPKCDPAVLSVTGDQFQEPDFAAIQTPTLVIRGRNSFGVSDATGRWLAKALPRATYAEVAGGNWPHVDAPWEFAEVVVAFSRSLAEPDRKGSI
jgi:pimeloyl-ACP methyl ester carboxylesterase